MGFSRDTVKGNYRNTCISSFWLLAHNCTLLGFFNISWISMYLNNFSEGDWHLFANSTNTDFYNPKDTIKILKSI